MEKHDHRVIRVEVEVDKERNPRQADRAVRVELTAFSKGPVIRAEAAAEDKMAALDLALDKMAGQMRRAADRKRVHRGPAHPDLRRQGARRGPAQPSTAAGRRGRRRATSHPARRADHRARRRARSWCARRSHPAAPMTLDQALYEMELVGHDFFLFVDKESERPSVVYRRHGYDYGVITLDVAER